MHRQRTGVPAAALAGLLIAFASPAARATPAADTGGARLHAGWIEEARIYPGAFLLEAKLDTGADVSSLDARDAVFFRRGGERWIRFTVTSNRGRTVTLERPVVRMARIKRHSHASQRRPVVRLGICIGDVYRETEVNLVDRARFRYRLLIGRRFMENRVIVDPARKFLHSPECKGAGPR